MHSCQRQTMFPNESTGSDVDAFTQDSEDNGTGWRHPVSHLGSNRVSLSPTFPTNQVPVIESLETCEAVRCKSDRDLPEVFFSSSVITSSSRGAAPPSRATHATAEQGMSASHLGSSRSNSLPVARTHSQATAASSSTTSRGDNIPAARRSPPLSFNLHYASTLSSSPLLRLRGGGESSLTGATSGGWGAPTPGATAPGNAGAGGWGTAPTQPQQPPTQWGTAARAPTGPPPAAPGLDGLDLAVSSTNNVSAKSPPATAPVSGSPTAPPMPGTSTWAQAAGKNLPPAAATPPGAGSSTKQQLEQLTTMRESLFSQDGWGGQHVNQDSNWDIPSSPEPGVTKDGVPVWKPNINNVGTDLWEANLRNGGQPPPAVAKTPWGHTPTSNIGGTWGEDDDPADAANVWTGVPSQQPGQPGPPQWNANQPMWPGPKKETEWGSGGGSNWGGDCRDPRGGPMDPRDMRAGDPRDMRGGMMGDMRGPMDMRAGGVDGMMRGDPRGISGRLNGGDQGMWGGPGPNQPPHHHAGPQQHPGPAKMQPQPQPGGGQWAGPPPKDVGGNKPSGWEEASPPQQRRNIPNYDDGTSLWGSQPQQSRGIGMPGKVSHWKDMPTPGGGAMGGRGGPGGMNCPPGMPQNRGMVNNGPGGMKDNNPPWMGPPRNGSWGDGHEGWGEEPKGGPMNSWGGGNEPPLTPNSWNKPGKNPGQWDGVGDMEWGHPQQKQGPKPLTKELVWGSKPFRILADLGYKKEDVEAALRASNMNLEDAIEMLRMNEPWPRHGDHTPGFDHPAGFPGGQRFNPAPMSFAPPGAVNNAQPSLANMSPAIVQKILTQQPPPQQQQAPPAPGATNQGAFRQQPSQAASNQPSTAQLRMLVQQIQMAVQAGYLNHQILNQPLAPQTLLLLNQLLQQIKVLQQLMQQHQMPPLKGNSNAVLHISVQITKTKQQIANLQNQIASQQAIYVKQQSQGQGQPDSFFPAARPDTIAGFDQMSIRETQVPSVGYTGQQSRLGQWKLPSLDKEAENEFSRAPGTTAKPALVPSHSSPNMTPLQLGQADGTWSTVTRSNSDTGWPEAGDGDKEPWPAPSSAAPAFTDLVPEFEPGKPWKGTQMKNSDDDPSITPGSVGRPLSLTSVKDSDSKSPTSSVDTPIPPLSLSSSTWSFTPGYSGPGKPGKTWGDAPPPTAVTSELWGAPKPASRGPPPGLNKNNNNGSSQQANGWGGLGGRSSWSSGGSGSGSGSGGTWGSSWLILKNLTPQIDGSTLKTLCVQHGPLQNFHLYLNHGIALAKYNTREEANKAQGALNNCVLVNTTIFAESPADSEVHSLLQHLGQQQQQPAWRPGQAKPDTWAAPSGSQLWPASASASAGLWGDAGGDHASSFLPGDLLGGESM